MAFNSKSPQAFKGFESIWTDMRMKVKMASVIMMFFFALQILFIVLHFYRIDPVYPSDKSIYFYTFPALLLSKIPIICDLDFFKMGKYDISAVLYVRAYASIFKYYNQHLIKGFYYSFMMWSLLPFIIYLLRQKSKSIFKEEHIRGTVLLGDKIFSKKIKKDQRNIQINQLLSIPFESENRHVFVVGKPGTGKTQLMNRSIQKVIDRNEKAIIYDFKGDFISHFYDPRTDYIFNPFDERTIGWNPFNEIANIQNIEAVCYSLIPPSQKQDTFWDEAARDVLFSVLLFCFKNNKKTNNEIYKMTIKTREQLLADFKTTEGCERGIRCLDEARTGASVLATFSQYVKFFEYCRDFDGEFSIKKWVADENKRGRIFIVNYAEIGQVMRPFLSLFIDLFASKILMLNENINRRIFFFLDEFGTLQRLNNIANLLKLSRSFGGSLWIGIQDIGQIEKVYGREISKTIVNSCANSIMFGCDDAETAEALARKIGEHEQRIVTENFSFGVENMRDGRGVSERSEVKKAVLAAEFLALIDLEFFLKLSGISEFTRSKLNHISYENRSEKFIEKQFKAIKNEIDSAIVDSDNSSEIILEVANLSESKPHYQPHTDVQTQSYI